MNKGGFTLTANCKDVDEQLLNMFETSRIEKVEFSHNKVTVWLEEDDVGSGHDLIAELNSKSLTRPQVSTITRGFTQPVGNVSFTLSKDDNYGSPSFTDSADNLFLANVSYEVVRKSDDPMVYKMIFMNPITMATQSLFG